MSIDSHSILQVLVRRAKAKRRLTYCLNRACSFTFHIRKQHGPFRNRALFEPDDRPETRIAMHASFVWLP